MGQTYFSQICHEFRRQLGMLLAVTRLHRVEFEKVDGIPVVRKQRRWFSAFIICAGNRFLKLTGSSISVLSRTQWLKWECEVDAVTVRGLVLDTATDASSNVTSLVWRQVSGTSLQRILAQDGYSFEQKLDGIRWSLHSLSQLHRNVADWGGGIRQTISHGDATINNVMIDFDTKTACWIDFDTRHDADMSELDRRVDDLCVLIYSAAARLPCHRYSKLADVLAAAEFDDQLFEYLRQRLASEWVDFSVTQLAQAPLHWSSAKAIRQALLQALSDREFAALRKAVSQTLDRNSSSGV